MVCINSKFLSIQLQLDQYIGLFCIGEAILVKVAVTKIYV